jgi:hypothetical protein
MQTFKGLSRGAKLVLSAGPVLLIGLFFNWQTLRIDYGPAGVAEQPQDGWDLLGLIVGALVIAVVTLVVLRHMSAVEMSSEVPWETLTLGLGGTAFGLVVVKNLTDADSTIASYVFVGVAGVLALGTFLLWAETRETRRLQLEGRDREVSSAA